MVGRLSSLDFQVPVDTSIPHRCQLASVVDTPEYRCTPQCTHVVLVPTVVVVLVVAALGVAVRIIAALVVAACMIAALVVAEIAMVIAVVVMCSAVEMELDIWAMVHRAWLELGVQQVVAMTFVDSAILAITWPLPLLILVKLFIAVHLPSSCLLYSLCARHIVPLLVARSWAVPCFCSIYFSPETLFVFWPLPSFLPVL